MSATEPYYCEHCHSQSSIYTHRLSPGIVNALIKFKQAVIHHDRNSIHTRLDMDGKSFELTKGEYGNWTMLRYHALVAKDDKAGAGYWLLTERGNQFLKGLRMVPLYVRTLNNHVLHDQDEPVVNVTIAQVIGSTPLFDDINSIERERVPLEAGQMGLGL
jgi:hypothetical protein